MRVCAEKECDTILSLYNDGSRCSIHTLPDFNIRQFFPNGSGNHAPQNNARHRCGWCGVFISHKGICKPCSRPEAKPFTEADRSNYVPALSGRRAT